MMESKVLTINNADISYYDIGKGKPIVLLHGFAGSKKYWEKVAPDLASDYGVIIPDLPGHGESGMSGERSSIEDMAVVMKEFLEGLSVDQVTMFGHSMGGYITLAFTEMYPEKLSGFSLVHSTTLPDSDEAKEGRDSNAKKVLEDGFYEIMAGLSKKLFSPDNYEKNAEDIKRMVDIGISTSDKGVINALLSMKERPDRTQVLERTDLPVLVITGDKDQIIPAEKAFWSDRPQIRRESIDGAGHMSMIEQPKELVRIMKDFLDELH